MTEPEGRPPESDDDVWAQIVAGYDQTPLEPVAPWPVEEDLDPEPEDAGDLGPSRSDAATHPGAGQPDGGRQDEGRDATGWRRDTDDTFVPPTPPPLPELDTVSQLAWGGLLGGPLFLLIAAVAGWTLPSLFLAFAVLAFVAGFVTLVVRMKDPPPDDAGPGNGAVL